MAKFSAHITPPLYLYLFLVLGDGPGVGRGVAGWLMSSMLASGAKRDILGVIIIMLAGHHSHDMQLLQPQVVLTVLSDRLITDICHSVTCHSNISLCHCTVCHLIASHIISFHLSLDILSLHIESLVSCFRS